MNSQQKLQLIQKRQEHLNRIALEKETNMSLIVRQISLLEQILEFLKNHFLQQFDERSALTKPIVDENQETKPIIEETKPIVDERSAFKHSDIFDDLILDSDIHLDS